MSKPSNAIIQAVRKNIREAIVCGDCHSCKLSMWIEDRETDRVTARLNHDGEFYYYSVFCTCYKRFITEPNALVMCESYQKNKQANEMLKLPLDSKKSRYVCHKDDSHGAMMAVPNTKDDSKPTVFYYCVVCGYKSWNGKKVKV